MRISSIIDYRPIPVDENGDFTNLNEYEVFGGEECEHLNGTNEVMDAIRPNGSFNVFTVCNDCGDVLKTEQDSVL